MRAFSIELRSDCYDIVGIQGIQAWMNVFLCFCFNYIFIFTFITFCKRMFMWKVFLHREEIRFFCGITCILGWVMLRASYTKLNVLDSSIIQTKTFGMNMKKMLEQNRYLTSLRIVPVNNQISEPYRVETILFSFTSRSTSLFA